VDIGDLRPIALAWRVKRLSGRRACWSLVSLHASGDHSGKCPGSGMAALAGTCVRTLRFAKIRIN